MTIYLNKAFSVGVSQYVQVGSPKNVYRRIFKIYSVFEKILFKVVLILII